MDTFVTRTELEKVVKDLRKLRVFLADTFGAKFLDFFGEDPSEEEEIASDKATGSCNTSDDVIVVRNTVSGTITCCKVTPHQSKPENVPSINAIQDPLALSVEETSTIGSTSGSHLAIIDGKSKKPSAAKSLVTCINLDSEEEEVEKLTPQTPPPVPSTLSSKNSDSQKEISSGTSCPSKISSISQNLSPLPESAATVPIKISAVIAPPKSLGSLRKRSLRLDEPSSKKCKTSAGSSADENEIIQCDECQLFIFSNQMENHRRNHALYDARKIEKTSSLFNKPYKCPVCQEKCGDIDKYEEHLNLLHPSLSGKPCPICSKVLSIKSRLKRHLLTHDELKLCCKICGKGYNRSDNLVAHMRNVHGENEEIVYFYCSVCNNAFASREGRDKHFDTAHPDATRVTLNLPVPGSKTQCQQKPKEINQDVANNGPKNKESENDSQTIVLSATSESEKIKFESGNLTSFEYEGDDD